MFCSVLGQDVIENIGFGQPTDSAKEGESDMVRIRLEPEGISESVAGQIIPLSLAQYRSYDFVTQRTVPSSVSNAINAIVDPAECKIFVIMDIYPRYALSFHIRR